MSDVIQGVLPTWLGRAGWIVIGLGLVGAACLPGSNLHITPGRALVASLGLGTALWMSPVLLVASLLYWRRGARSGLEATRLEAVEMGLLALGGAALAVALALTG